MQGRKLHELFFTTVETLYIALYSTGFNQQRMRLPFQYKMPHFEMNILRKHKGRKICEK